MHKNQKIIVSLGFAIIASTLLTSCGIFSKAEPPSLFYQTNERTLIESLEHIDSDSDSQSNENSEQTPATKKTEPAQENSESKNTNNTNKDNEVTDKNTDKGTDEGTDEMTDSRETAPEESLPEPQGKTTGTNHNVAADAYSYPAAEVKKCFYGGTPVEGKKLAFLTFDDGLNPESTPLLLDELKKQGVPASFFILGSTISEHSKPVLERMFNEGHAIGLHSYNHQYDALYPNRVANVAEIIRQYELGLSALKEVLGENFSTKIWRFPGGSMSWKNIKAAQEALYQKYGTVDIDWNSINGDAEASMPTSEDEMLSIVEEGWKAYGAPDTIVILMHDYPQKQLTRSYLGKLVNFLKSKDFEFGILE